MTWRARRSHIGSGELVPVLEEYSPPFPGFYVYFPRRRRRSAAFQALIDYVCREIGSQVGCQTTEEGRSPDLGAGFMIPSPKGADFSSSSEPGVDIR